MEEVEVVLTVGLYLVVGVVVGYVPTWKWESGGGTLVTLYERTTSGGGG